MRNHRWLYLSALCGALSFTSAAMPAAFVADAAESLAATSDAHEDQLYSDATRAINESRWSEAESLLDQVIALHGSRADAAAYWKAYVENKENRQPDALEACANLRHSYPQSKWIKDCSALEIEIRGRSGSPVQPQAEQDEELKLLALNSIMQGGNPNALPILQQILEGQQSERLKERALFVLAQDRSKPAQDLMGQIVRGEKDPHLQIKAIRLVAVAHGPDAADILAGIYGKSSDASVKRAVLDSYLVMDAPDKLVQVAQHDSDPELARHAVNELGALGAVSQLSDIYHATTIKEVKEAVINAYAVAGARGADALGAIASNEQDSELRRKAIRGMGICCGSSNASTLLSIYSKSADAESRKAVIDALFVGNDAHDLVTLARSEKDLAAKKELVGKLAIMHSKEATDYMLEILSK